MELFELSPLQTGGGDTLDRDIWYRISTPYRSSWSDMVRMGFVPHYKAFHGRLNYILQEVV